MSLATPASVQKLQTALHAKAKEAPSFRFYALYDKVYRKDFWVSPTGAAGERRSGRVDGVRFEDIEAYGVERWLDELAQELKKPNLSTAARATGVYTKPDGKQRPLGIPAVRDRMAELAAVLVSTDFRGRSAAGTVRLPSRPQRVGRRKSSPSADLCWPSRNRCAADEAVRRNGTWQRTTQTTRSLRSSTRPRAGPSWSRPWSRSTSASIMSGRRLSGCTASGERGNPEGSSRQRESEAKRKVIS